FFDAPTPPHLSTLSLHDALPIFRGLALAARLRIDKPDEPSYSHPCIVHVRHHGVDDRRRGRQHAGAATSGRAGAPGRDRGGGGVDRKSTRLNSSHLVISYAVFCL